MAETLAVSKEGEGNDLCAEALQLYLRAVPRRVKYFAVVKVFTGIFQTV